MTSFLPGSLPYIIYFITCAIFYLNRYGNFSTTFTGLKQLNKLTL